MNTPLSEAYELIFTRVKKQFVHSGKTIPEIMGFPVKKDKLGKTYSLSLLEHHKSEIPALVNHLLNKYPIVAVFFEAFVAPSIEVPASLHPERREVVMIAIYTEASSYVALCDIYPAKRWIVRDELHETPLVQGNLARNQPVKH
jgi:hypothetical protein